MAAESLLAESSWGSTANARNVKTPDIFILIVRLNGDVALSILPPSTAPNENIYPFEVGKCGRLDVSRSLL
jgi:hypothetical protein